MKFKASNIKKKDPDITLWHYTSPAVLWKMLSGEFYATHYRFMNDSAEIVHGLMVYKRFLEDEKSLADLQFVINDLQKRDFFLWCFSEDQDNLYHWRSYTPQGGFSIGFSHNEMCDLLNNIEYDVEKLKDGSFPNYHLVQCQYKTEDDIAVFISEATAEFKKAIEDLSADDKSLLDQAVSKTKSDHFSGAIKFLNEKSPTLLSLLRDRFFVAFELQAQCPVFKNPSFEVESEHRLVVTGGDLRTQIEYIGNKPRIKIPLPELAKCIKGVCVSPHGDVEQNHLLAEIAKERFGLDFKIHESESTFNGK